ncbi:hypothetical protein Pflav_034020 [Phytohabitans flavus]|uniref:ABC-2 type transporter transmembrane domain-containing protein n=1 Tax=Phytohabitans flavus TaxID=1076124 RepID=A0A6F8XT15_9ACTN|nr:ABC transporter permease [Phytohabitans flavus]BCB76992.1 hypothetical protein Pflav_034020 [Phytohabitans flavus]
MASLRWALADGWTMTRRNMAHVVRAPEEIVIYFSLPIMFVLVFGYVFGSGMSVPDGGNYREYLLPGVFVMTMLYGLGATATGVAVDVNRGVVDRFRSIDMARSALLVGRSGADLLRALLEMATLVVCGLLVGWQWRDGVLDALAAVGLILLLRFALTWVGIYFGLIVPNPDTVAVVVFPVAFPLTALSNVFVAPTSCRTGSARSRPGTRSPRRWRPAATSSATRAPAATRGWHSIRCCWRSSGRYC